MRKDTKYKLFIFFTFYLLITASLIPANLAYNYQYVEKNNNQTSKYPTYDLLIISPKDFLNELKPLIKHKNKIGIKTKLVTLDDLYKQTYWQGQDKPEKIKYFIKNAYEIWSVKFVLLVGGMKNQGPNWYLPIRYVYTYDGYREKKFISDLYFADIYDKYGNFSNWDKDNDNIFGEWLGKNAQDDYIDLYPEVFLGRIPCRNKFEVKTMVKKIIQYETKSYGYNWVKRVAVVSGDTYPHNTGRFDPNWTDYEGEVMSLHILENMTDYEHIKLFVSDGSLKGIKDTIKLFNKGCGFICLIGHGSPLTLQTYDSKKMKPVFQLTNPSMISLKNKNRLPICVLGSCNLQQFDVSIFNFLSGFKEYGFEYFFTNNDEKLIPGKFFQCKWAPECFGWKLVSKNNGGAIATVGCTGLALSKEDKETFEGGIDYLIPYFFRQIGVDKIEFLGQAWANSIKGYLDKYPINWSTPSGGDSSMDAKTVEQWILFGDPSLKIGGYNSG